jgi:hypothetical protein
MMNRAGPNRVRSACLFASLAACLAFAAPARADVIYDFSLPANGEVGPIEVQLTFPDFLPAGGLNVLGVTGPEVTAFSSGTPVDLPLSFVGVDIDPAVTLFGLALFSPSGGFTLLNDSYPADFFSFVRAPNQTGTFLSSSGLVVSDFTLATATPTATLTVTSTPEPATLLLFGLGAVGVVARRRARANCGRVRHALRSVPRRRDIGTSPRGTAPARR